MENDLKLVVLFAEKKRRGPSSLRVWPAPTGGSLLSPRQRSSGPGPPRRGARTVAATACYRSGVWHVGPGFWSLACWPSRRRPSPRSALSLELLLRASSSNRQSSVLLNDESCHLSRHRHPGIEGDIKQPADVPRLFSSRSRRRPDSNGTITVGFATLSCITSARFRIKTI